MFAKKKICQVAFGVMLAHSAAVLAQEPVIPVDAMTPVLIDTNFEGEVENTVDPGMNDTPSVSADIVMQALDDAVADEGNNRSVTVDPSLASESPMPAARIDLNEEIVIDDSEITTPKIRLVSAKDLKDEKIVSKKADKVNSVRSAKDAFTIEVEPGINQIIPISQGHYNRIVTPFENPLINTVSNDSIIEVHNEVIYVATSNTEPVTLFISPDVDDESIAISLTLAPRKIPPVEARLKFSNQARSALPTRQKAKKWEESQPYVDGIVSALREVAMGEIPEGYSIGKPQPKDPYPTCLQQDFQYNFLEGQYVRGHHYLIAVGVVQNMSDQVIEVDEFACVDGNIVASASWPHTFLMPGQKSEMYVMMKLDYEPVVSRTRKSLIED